jgi:hypothetical protein
LLLHLRLLLPWFWSLVLTGLLYLLSSGVIGLLRRRPLMRLRLILLDSWRCLILSLVWSLLIPLVLLSLSGISGIGGNWTIVTLHAIRASRIGRAIVVRVLVWPTPILIPLLVGGALARIISWLTIRLTLSVLPVAALVGGGTIRWRIIGASCVFRRHPVSEICWPGAGCDRRTAVVY